MNPIQYTTNSPSATQGAEASIVIHDIGVTEILSFTNNPRRCLVNLTRATDLSIVVSQLANLKKGNNNGKDAIMA
ncbi:hypothetical protein VE00_00359 [Pseudogymnoascus sp. WSF 3629]|nr:hypothetical protein VE00_00359 [Pseudogymnoascus sp. WSF 3629]